MTETATAAAMVTINPLSRRHPARAAAGPARHRPGTRPRPCGSPRPETGAGRPVPAAGRALGESRAPRHPLADCARPVAGQRELARRFALRLVEVLTGVRPVGQLLRHTTHDGYRQLTALVRRGPLRTPAGASRLGLGPVHEFAPAPDALEVCVRVAAGRRHHVVAFRLERHRRTEHWQCAAVETR
ncbi:Rv3235 family protein [Kitasatospora sp. RB6PN24]|uniref:Rv3235 family protein n=1 Tax=Kitasatospora humi TaxID=2893891 RepID=UPI001E3138D4|nr:Rv3235 family protein [Kitasatospora humi]MCC9312048.1 Rv3235 family protein [Kitasatospora humi]